MRTRNTPNVLRTMGRATRCVRRYPIDAPDAIAAIDFLCTLVRQPWRVRAYEAAYKAGPRIKPRIKRVVHFEHGGPQHRGPHA